MRNSFVTLYSKGNIHLTDKYDIDVLIVGAGPTGSTLAADLLRRGVGVQLIDKAAHSFKGSRAKGIQPRTQEVLEDLGVLKDAHAEGGAYPLMGIHVGPLTVPFRMQKRKKVAADVPYPNVLLLPQYRTDAILHRLLERNGLTIAFNTEIISFEQDDSGVTTTLSSGEKIRSKYLIGADGGSSTVRKAASIRFIGETNEADRMIIIDGTINGLSRNRWHVWPRIHGKQVAACPLPHTNQFQVMIRLTPDESVNLDDTALATMFDTLTGLHLQDITWRSVFRPNVRLAEHYQSGRVFLAGDAAHVHTPAGAQGLNTGIQDAYNLSWKISQVIKGASETLLDSYEAERQPIAAQVLKLSSELYAEIEQKSLSGLKRGDEERQLGISYYGGPLAPTNSSATKKLRVGDRAPDAPCKGPDGLTRLFELYQGPHFTLLAFGTNAINTLSTLDWPTAGAELRCYAIGNGMGVDENHITDTTGKLSSIYGITGDILMLIRPDGYIGSIIKDDWLATFNNIAKRFTI